MWQCAAGYATWPRGGGKIPTDTEVNRVTAAELRNGRGVTQGDQIERERFGGEIPTILKPMGTWKQLLDRMHEDGCV